MESYQAERLIGVLERIADSLASIARDTDLVSDCVVSGDDDGASSFNISYDESTEQPD